MAATDFERLGPADTSSADQTPGDEEDEGAQMSLVEHLEELRARMIKSLAAVAIFSVVGFFFWERILGFLLTPLPSLASRLTGRSGGPQLIATQIGEPFLVALKLSVAIGIVIAMPVILYQTWGYIAPALTRKERRYALPFTLLGFSLFAIGTVVGFFVLRYPVEWLINFGGNNFVVLPDANEYFSFVSYFLIAFGLIFELPLVLTFLGVAGIISSTVLRQKRMYILFGLWILSCFVTPGADPYSPVIIGVSFTLLFELSVILLRILKK